MTKTALNLTLTAALLAAVAAPSFGQAIPAPTRAEEARLLAVLTSDAPQFEKAEACRQLGVIGTENSVPTLAALLGDEKMSHMARYALEPIPGPAVDDALRAALGKLKGPLLVGVIGSIGVRRDAKAIAPLTRLLTDADHDVAQAAARALGKIGTSAAAKSLQAAVTGVAPANQAAFCEGLFRCAESLTAQKKGGEAVAIYDQLLGLQPAPVQVRAGALRGAILARGKKGRDLLAKNLRSDDYVLFAAAIRASHEMPGAEASKTLIAAMDQPSADKRVLLIQTLGARRDKAAFPAIANLARSSEPAVRVAAISALGQLGDASVVPAMFEATADANSDVARAAQAVLLGLPGKAVDAAIAQMLKKGDARFRRTAIELIGQRRAAGASDVLLKAAGDGDRDIRKTAIQALAESGTTGDLPGMIGLLLSRKDAQDLAATEAALGAVCGRATNPQQCADQLLAALPKAEVAPKCALLRTLRGVGGARALAAVRAAQKDGNAEIQDAAFRSLCEWSTAEAAPDLLAIAKGSSDAKQRILATRGYIGLIKSEGTPVSQRLAMCREAAALAERPEEKKLLLGSLGGIASAESLAMAMTYLGNAATRNEAALAALAICGQILEKCPAAVAEAMEKVSKTTDNRGILRRVEPLLNEARAKAGKK
jgi:HEAT repeat protein